MRSLAPTLTDAKARYEVEWLAFHYERLAEFVDSTGPVTRAANRKT
jgi:hypothetical protein